MPKRKQASQSRMRSRMRKCRIPIEACLQLADAGGVNCRRTSTLSQRQLPQGAPSTTSQRTLRARHETQALAALRFVTLAGWPDSVDVEGRFLESTLVRPSPEWWEGGGEGDMPRSGDDADDSDIVKDVYICVYLLAVREAKRVVRADAAFVESFDGSKETVVDVQGVKRRL